MKKPVRKIHVNGQEWHYVVFCGGAKVFPPNSKSCMAMVWYDNCPQDVPDRGSTNADGTRDFRYSQEGWRPAKLKAFIERELEPRRGAWIAAGKPTMNCIGGVIDGRVEEWHKELGKKEK